jgi:hypothetical protein
MEGVGRLPLILSRRLMKDVFLPINGQDAILHHALPVSCKLNPSRRGGLQEMGRGTYHLFLTL